VFETIAWSDEGVVMIDQRKLPAVEEYPVFKTYEEVAQAIKEIKAGKVEYRVDKAGVVHAAIGKVSFEAQQLLENANALAASVIKAKPAAAKGRYIKGVHVSSTMGPGVPVDTVSVEAGAKA